MDGCERLPPTNRDLERDDTRPYFLWWTDVTVGELRRKLVSPDLEERAYFLGALLREANTRDVWLFTHPAEIRSMWPRLQRYLGKTRAMWAYLLRLEPARAKTETQPESGLAPNRRR